MFLKQSSAKLKSKFETHIRLVRQTRSIIIIFLQELKVCKVAATFFLFPHKRRKRFHCKSSCTFYSHTRASFYRRAKFYPSRVFSSLRVCSHIGEEYGFSMRVHLTCIYPRHIARPLITPNKWLENLPI